MPVSFVVVVLAHVPRGKCAMHGSVTCTKCFSTTARCVHRPYDEQWMRFLHGKIGVEKPPRMDDVTAPDGADT